MTKVIAAKIEACIKQTHIEVTNQYAEGHCLEINGGVACFSGYDSFLSQVVGWGFFTAPHFFHKEIELIEQFYRSLKHPRIDIELSPYVGKQLPLFLTHRGYQLTELSNVSFLDMNSYVIQHHFPDRYQIREIQPSEMEEWAKRVAIGFGFIEAREQFLHYVRAKGVCAFAVFDQGNLVAGATIAMHGDTCDLGVASTLPLYRGKGLQKMLLSARLNHAKQQGVSLATVTTEPGTISDRNVQKIGFRCAYTRTKMTLNI